MMWTLSAARNWRAMPTSRAPRRRRQPSSKLTSSTPAWCSKPTAPSSLRMNKKTPTMTNTTTSNTKRVAAFICFSDRENAHAGKQILEELGYRFIEHPEYIDPVDANTTFVEAWKPLLAGDDEDVGADILNEVQGAIGHLGSACEAGIVAADEWVNWLAEGRCH